MSNIFYCPKCNKIDGDFNFNKRTQITWKNIRDGYGRPITHIVCPYCKYELSGFINATGMYNKNDMYDKENCVEYIRHVIQGYSNSSYCDSKKLLELIRKDIKSKE